MIEQPEDMLGFLAARRDGLAFDLAFTEPFAPWQDALRRAWLASLPPHDGPMVVEDALERLEPRRRLRIMQVRYASGDTGEAALLLPREATTPVPAIVLMHDHGGAFAHGWRKMAEDGVPPSHHYHGHSLADDLVASGFAVLCIDAFGWGSRNYGGYDRQQALAYHALQLGWSLAGILAADDLQSLAWIKRQPEIDPGRVGVMGFSMGGFRAWQAAALDPDVKACASLSWIGRRREMLAHANPLLAGHSGYYFLHPALATRADYPDMAGLAADRPLFMRAGNADRHMPAATAGAALEDISRMARASGGPFDGALFEGGHACPPSVQKAAIAFLKANL